MTAGTDQVRGVDLTDITFVRGMTGWIVFEPLATAEVTYRGRQARTLLISTLLASAGDYSTIAARCRTQ